MFFEFVTKRKEHIFLNVLQILYITPDKNNDGTVIVDTIGVDYRSNEPYESMKTRLQEVTGFKS